MQHFDAWPKKAKIVWFWINATIDWPVCSNPSLNDKFVIYKLCPLVVKENIEKFPLKTLLIWKSIFHSLKIFSVWQFEMLWFRATTTTTATHHQAQPINEAQD